MGIPNVEFARRAKFLHEDKVLGANDNMWTKNREIALKRPEAVPIRPRPAARLVRAPANAELQLERIFMRVDS